MYCSMFDGTRHDIPHAVCSPPCDAPQRPAANNCVRGTSWLLFMCVCVQWPCDAPPLFLSSTHVSGRLTPHASHAAARADITRTRSSSTGWGIRGAGHRGTPASQPSGGPTAATSASRGQDKDKDLARARHHLIARFRSPSDVSVDPSKPAAGMPASAESLLGLPVEWVQYV